MTETTLSELGMSMAEFAKPKTDGDLPTCGTCPALRPIGGGKLGCKRRGPSSTLVPFPGPMDAKGNQTQIWKNVALFPPRDPGDEACFEHPKLASAFEGERR